MLLYRQVFILDSLSSYTPRDPDEAKGIAERVLPRLAHANSAVVLSAIKVVMKNLQHLESHEDALFFCQKMTPPLGLCAFYFSRLPLMHTNLS